jgi:hypothetical protein
MKPEKGEDVRVLMLALIAGLAAPAWAQEIDSIQLLSQGEFRLLSEDLGGVGIKLVLFNFNLEADKTGDVTGYSAKVGLRF